MTYIIKTPKKEDVKTLVTLLDDSEYVNPTKIKYYRITFLDEETIETGYNDDLEYYTKPENLKYYPHNLRKDIENKRIKIVSLPEFIEEFKIKYPEQYIKIKLTKNI